MEKQQKKDMNREYTLFSGGEIIMEDYSIQMVLHHLPEGLLPSSVLTLNQEQIWSCEHTRKQNLAQHCELKELGNEELRWIYGGILNNLKETQEFLLDTNHLLLEPEEIYLDSKEQRIWNSFVPFHEKDIWQSLRELAQYLLGHLDQRDPEAVRIAYGMFRYFAQGGCNLERAWEILCEKTECRQEESTEQGEALDFAEEVRKEAEPEKSKKENWFPIVGWIMMSLSWAASIFLLSYVALNEWYLSNTGKILILILAIALGIVGVITWKHWRPEIKKKNPMELQSEIADTETQGVSLVRVDTGDTISVEQTPAIIGKHTELVQIRIQEPTVSRIHGKLTCIQGEYYLEDLNSKNGTYVNGKRLEPQKPVHLKDGDILVFADMYYYFRL